MNSLSANDHGPIGVFDSGYGGLTILEHMLKVMPQNDFIYFGDNARTPYGTRSFQVVYEYTLQCVTRLFEMGCPLVILACNTASAKALRTIQQVDLPKLDPTRRVLGIIRPTVENIDSLTKTRHIGLLATPGTVKSLSYPLEIGKLYPDIEVTGEACPIWVPLVENGLAKSAGTDFFVRQHVESLLSKDPLIDTIILGCTHYPLLIDSIRRFVPEGINIICQGQYVAASLQQYLERHPEMACRCTMTGTRRFVTTESSQTFLQQAGIFLPDNARLDVSSISL
ncbi:MAG: glutamate racemase [Bacteroidaceae bacterium]|nr:glutamate racemase [Bacteroidaceae bacterium]